MDSNIALSAEKKDLNDQILLESLFFKDILTRRTGRLEFKVSTEEEKRSFESFLPRLIEMLDADIRRATMSHLAKLQISGSDLRPFARYLLESFLSFNKRQGAPQDIAGYKSAGLKADFIKSIYPHKLTDINVMDFGFGNWDTLAPWKKLGCRITGFDLSPFFVQGARNENFKSRLVSIDAKSDAIEEHFFEIVESADIVSSTLTLDRVGNPKQLLSNMVTLLKRGGFFSIQTLLPITPVDDGPNVVNPIVYTEKENQISLSTDPTQCICDLIALIEKLGIVSVTEADAVCEVVSLDGRQDYTVKCINGFKE
jgi:SAM-dependent methyltransferase